MVDFPLEFEVEAEATEGISNLWTCKSGSLEPISSAIPTEFGGPGGAYCPEDFFAMSVLSCIIATFKVYAEKSEANFQTLKASAKLKMDRDASSGALSIPEILIDIQITGASDTDKVRKTLDTAISHCSVSNSIKSGKNFTIDIK